MSILTATDANYEEKILKSDLPVLLDFWAEWCGPCKAIAPILDALATELQGKVIIAKMNVDDNQEVPAKIGVRGIPMLALFKDGELIGHKTGLQGQKDLSDWILSLI